MAFRKILILVICMGLIVQTAQTTHAQSDADYTRAQIALKLVQSNLGLDDRSTKLEVKQISESVENNRSLRRVTLAHPQLGTTTILINGPLEFERIQKRLSVVFISAGFLTGANAIRLLPTQRDDVILVGFDYPTTPAQIKADASLLPKAIRVVPGQMALVMEWIRDQVWADPYSIHPVGVSLGTLFLPLALKLAESRGFIARTTSFLFGGAHLEPVLDSLLKEVPRDIAKPTIDLILSMTAPYDPKMYLPLLRGPFLQIYGTNDNVFPRSTSILQFVLLPQPKESHEIKGPHIDPSKPEVVKETADVFLQFLDRNL